jgi:hypothetical protein
MEAEIRDELTGIMILSGFREGKSLRSCMLEKSQDFPNPHCVEVGCTSVWRVPKLSNFLAFLYEPYTSMLEADPPDRSHGKLPNAESCDRHFPSLSFPGSRYGYHLISRSSGNSSVEKSL